MKSVALAFGGLLVVAACAGAPLSPSSGAFILYEATSQTSQIVVIDSRSHAVVRTLPLGTPSPDWKHLYSLTNGTLVDFDPETGATLHTLRLPGSYELPAATLNGMPGGVSQNGKWLALESPGPADSTSTATHMLVIDTSYASPAVRIDLAGSFRFDAISNDGARLYLIGYVSPATYQVRMYDVGARGLSPTVVFDKSDGSEAMTGLRLSGIPSPDGHWLYSVYVRQGMSPFIHALSLDSPIAFCIDLPGGGYSTDRNAFHWSIAMPASGVKLFATNAATGVASEVNLAGSPSPALARSVMIGEPEAVAGTVQDVQAKELGTGASVVTADGKSIVTAAGTGVVWIDTTDLHVESRLLDSWTVLSLALSPDGKVLWALADSGKIAEISMASRQVTTTFSANDAYPMALMRVEAA